MCFPARLRRDAPRGSNDMSTTAVTEVARPADYPDVAMYIDGAWVAGAAGRGDDVVNPATGQALGRVPFAEPEDVDRAIEAARVAFQVWRDAGPEARSAILLRASALIHQRAADIGRVMTLEEGKPLPEATGEVHRAATLLAWDCEEGRRAYGRIIPSSTNEVLSVRQVPVGPVGAFVPWNFPAGGPMRKIAAALSAGCSIVIKPSEEVPGTVYLLARAFEDAGLPPGVLNLVYGVPDEISRRVIASPAIRFIAFTGSVPVGKHIAGLAAASMKPSIMELGGHAPVIVCADTDPVAAARSAVRPRRARGSSTRRPCSPTCRRTRRCCTRSRSARSRRSAGSATSTRRWKSRTRCPTGWPRTASPTRRPRPSG